MMKKNIVVLIALIFSISLVACSNAKEVAEVSEVNEVEVIASEEDSLEAEEVEEIAEEEEIGPFILGRTNYSSEQFTNVTVLQISNDPGCIEWTSENPDVAQVINGRLFYFSEGETKIHAEAGKHKNVIDVRVTPSIMFNEPITGVDVYAYDKFILTVDKDTNIPDGFGDKIEKFISLIERETGLSYVTNMGIGFECQDTEMFQVFVTDKTSATCATDICVFLNPMYVDPSVEGYDEVKADEVILEELTHTIQLRNSVDIGHALCEGYAINTAMSICENELGHVGAEAQYIEEQLDYIKWFEKLTKNNVYKLLIDQPVDVHPFSFFFVKYINETYGKEIMIKLIDDINTKFREVNILVYGAGSTDVLTSEDFLEILKTETDENVLANYVDWMNSNF